MQSVSISEIVRLLTVAAAAVAGMLLATGVAVAASMKADAGLPMLSPELGDFSLALGLLSAFAAVALLATGRLVRPLRTTL